MSFDSSLPQRLRGVAKELTDLEEKIYEAREESRETKRDYKHAIARVRDLEDAIADHRRGILNDDDLYAVADRRAKVLAL